MNESPKRILQIVDELNITSGTSSVLMNFYRNIDREKIQFDFLVCDHNNENSRTYQSEILSMGGRIFNYHFSMLDLIKRNKQIEKFFIENRNKYIAVHLHCPSICKLTLKYAKKYGWKNRIVHSHSSMMSSNILKKILHKYLTHNIKSYANYFWACSTEAAHFLYGEGIKKFELIKNAVDTKRFNFQKGRSLLLKKEMGLDDKIIVLHVSNYATIKNMLFFVDVMSCIKNEKIQYVFVGDGKNLINIKNKIENNGLSSQCIFIGKTTNVEKYFAMADVFVLPSLREGLPVTAIEAQASGIPCFLSSSITKEANAGMVQYIKIKQEDWVKKISQIEILSDEQRMINCNTFKLSQFSLENESRRVQEIYLSMK